VTLANLAVDRLTVRYGALEAVSELSVTFEADTIVGVIGPNGAGKTTLLNALSGFTHISSGSVAFGSTDLTHLPGEKRVALGIVRTFQTARLLETETVFLNVALGCERHPQPSVVEQALAFPRSWRARRRDVEATEEILEALGLSSVASRVVSELPYATRRLVELARIFVVHPSVVLLDEPAAGADRLERDSISHTLRAFHARNPYTMIVVEHDVDFVRRLCGFVVAMDSGRLIASGPPDQALNTREVREAYFGIRHDDA
jgi:branched-chain amino acid transport system ATP-binding protein